MGPEQAAPPAGDGEHPSLLAPVEQPRNPAELAAVGRHRKGGRAGRNVPVATAVGLSLGLLVVLSLVFARPAFVCLVAVAVALGCWELGTALRRADLQVAIPPTVVGGVAMVVAAWFGGTDALVPVFGLTVVVIIAWSLTETSARPLANLAASVFVVAYLPLLASFAVLLARPDDGLWRVLTFVILVVCSDLGGFVVGVKLGKHPMSPTISPKKSWEGFAGSAVSGVAGGIALSILAFDGQWWQGAALGAVAVCSATLGDLGESMIKRDLGIKDMSSLLPGHGGIMDRLDSLLATAPVVWVLLTALLPPAT